MAATIMAVDKQPTLSQAAQFLATHGRIIRTVHRQMGTLHPVTIGVVKPANYPSPATASMVVSMSLPIYHNSHDKEICNLLSRRMRQLLANEACQHLSSNSGRCAENEGFLRCIILLTSRNAKRD
jgi:hypothetical protein